VGKDALGLRHGSGRATGQSLTPLAEASEFRLHLGKHMAQSNRSLWNSATKLLSMANATCLTGRAVDPAPLGVVGRVVQAS
jgi:hypothetical protein